MKKNISYAQKKKKKTFDWNGFLDKDFTRNKNFSKETLNKLIEASRLSSKWVTCACGNQCAIIPRNLEGQPKDYTLASLGMDFFSKINSMHSNYVEAYEQKGQTLSKNLKYKIKSEQNSAKKILSQIENRSKQIVKEILKK
jgi:hypothetical protein